MRRKDREVTAPEKIADIIDRCVCCRIGFNDSGSVYIVPLSFGYERAGDTFVFYFHSAREGRKIDLIHTSPHVGFEMDTDYQLNEADMACGYSARFRSVIGNGVMSIVEDDAEKRRGLTLLMAHNTEKRDWPFDEKMLAAVMVFKLEVTTMSCKEHL